jgi:hypothetical protein
MEAMMKKRKVRLTRCGETYKRFGPAKQKWFLDLLDKRNEDCSTPNSLTLNDAAKILNISKLELA